MSVPASYIDLSETVRYGVVDGIAVVVLANPPVNGLSNHMRIGMDAGIRKGMDDPAVKAIVLTGDPAGKGFCGGADLRQLNTAAGREGPSIHDMFDYIASAPKAVVAAIHGFALGGGLETALGCHFRIAEKNANLGLPEANLGLLPGGGGTQRLPRLIGAVPAMDMMLTAAPVNGERGAELGIVEASFTGDPIEAGVAWALQNAVGVSDLPVVANNPVPDADSVDLAAAHAAIRPNARNGRAQHAIINCVEGAINATTFADGMAVEQREFRELVASPEAAALQYQFFAEKEAAKVIGLSKETALRPVNSLAVIGAGTMGGGIAMVFANAGIPVTLIEQGAEQLERGVSIIKGNYEATAAKGRLSAEQVATRVGLITPTLELEAAKDADLIIEAVFEDLEVKKELFTKLDAIAKPGAILATNTSRLDIDQIAAVTSRPQDVIGLHFFSPANVMKLLEVVRADKTADDVIATSMKLAQKVGKIAVLARICDGFIGNRMLSPYVREAHFLLEEGASPQQLDGALQAFGLAMGPIAMGDLAGLDVAAAGRRRQRELLPSGVRFSKVADIVVDAGRLGQKTGAGFYKYEAGNRKPIPDPEVEQIIEKCAADAGITRRAITDEEIVEREMLALVNEGAKLLDEGIAQRASDIDVIYTNGYGFPAYRGGPMHWASQQGLDVVLEKIKKLREVHGEYFWTPAPLIERLVAEGKTTF
ncbi:3-hydroxyacyl-CoA dehydrogenase NAD-binding domain-containing protein [Cumulibacter soli]|uniref:3-hydroxyacyl-CoA dehydrogenase NAD-binding domain-containing protein n=1 Tax=Cumulibacter soli TaxID=2546344 RepID=UPI00106823BD|nr:3-hydroxyacyl-CoA dehydrogenase NAD-binding domain-containing protein [Cumulibacter soli]